MVIDQLAIEAGENRCIAGETCPELLAAFGRESSDATGVWGHPRQGRGAAFDSTASERGRGMREHIRSRDHRLERRQFSVAEASGEVNR